MAVQIDPKWHGEQIEQFTSLRGKYEKYADLLNTLLKLACKAYAPEAHVQVRAKTLSSFAEKVVRKAPKYHDPVNQFTDLCGARVITHTLSEVDQVCRFIESHFVVDVANSEDKRSALGAKQFGYLSVHYVVQLPKADAMLGLSLPQELIQGAYKAEIQVRTLLQHAWAGISHDILYKNDFRPPTQWHREMNRLAAMLEETDQCFSRFVGRLHVYTANHGAYMPDAKRRAEIETLQRILNKEPNSHYKPNHAMRIAAIYKAVGGWEEVVKTLKPYSQTGSFALLRELGYALCRADKHRPHTSGYQEGIDFLKKALASDPGDAQSHACMAWALKNAGKAQDISSVREHLGRAYALKPSDPYYLSAYLEQEICQHNALDHIALMRPAIEQAIETCRAHAEAGIEIPCAHFTMGRYYLFLKETWQSLSAYLGGLRLCLEDGEKAIDEPLEEEIDFIYSLDKVKATLPAYEIIKRVLIIARFVRSGIPFKGTDEQTTDESTHFTTRQALADLKTTDAAHQGPVVIVAGSCAPAEEDHVQQYKKLLLTAFACYRGTIIAGGTRNGIGRLVGDLADLSASKSNSPIETVAYLPQYLPHQARYDERYHRHLTTQGNDFSPLEPLQMWIDLLACGIDPRQVKVLGLGGGNIAAFEYRLALLLGAEVGILAGSGRQADALLDDPVWNSADNLLRLIDDSMTIRAFITNPQPMIPPEQVKALAAESHNRFLKQKRQELLDAPKEANLQPWDKLAPDLQAANLHQISYSVEILQQSGFFIQKAAQGDPFVDPVFTQEEIEHMAEMEHGRWNLDRIREKYRPGDEKDLAAKIHDCLVKWEVLKENIKEYDRTPIADLPRLLWRAGFKIVRKQTP